MISIAKGEAPQALLDRATDATDELCKTYDADSAAFDSGALKLDVKSAVYGHQDVRNSLASSHHGKCAYWDGGWTCRVEQVAYGHIVRKPTWLYANGCDLPSMTWGVDPRKLPSMVQPSKARRETGGRTPSVNAHGVPDSLRIHTPPAFRDLLISMARSVPAMRAAA
jgi:hypothetical protein